MRIIDLCKEVRGLRQAARLGEMWGELPEAARQRYHWVLFIKKLGVKTAIVAFGVSRRTLFRMQRLLKKAEWDPRALRPKSEGPKAQTQI